MAYVSVGEKFDCVSEEQKKDIENEVRAWLITLCSEVKKVYPRYVFKDVVCSGSVAEDVKVGIPDEFDFLLILDGDFTVQDDPTRPPGFFGILQKDSSGTLQPLNAVETRKMFYTALMLIIKGKIYACYAKKFKNFHKEGTSYDYVQVNFNNTRSAAVTLTVPAWVFHSRVHCDVSVDLVLAYCVHNSDVIPTWKKPIWNKLNEFLAVGRACGFHVPELQPLPQTDICFVPKLKTEDSSHLDWRISFSFHEKLLFNSLTQQQRNAFIIMKIILEDGKLYLQDLFIRKLHDFDKPHIFSTYIIKTVLFHCYWKIRGSGLTDEKIASVLLNYLISSIRSRSLPHFFVPSIDFFQEVEDIYAGEMKHMLAFLEETLTRLPDKFPSLQERVALRSGVVSGIAGYASGEVRLPGKGLPLLPD